jgi:hypothetical protein
VDTTLLGSLIQVADDRAQALALVGAPHVAPCH